MECKVIDIKAAFLEGPLDKPTFIEWPEMIEYFGFIDEEEKEEIVIQLLNSMYSNVDAALRFFKELKMHLVNPKGKLNMEQSLTDDPSLLFKKDDNGKLLLTVICHINGCVCLGIMPEGSSKLEPLLRCSLEVATPLVPLSPVVHSLLVL